MRVHIYNNKFVTTEIKSFHLQFDSPKSVGRHESYHIIRHNGFLVEQRRNIEIDKLFFKCNHGNDIDEY